MNLPEVGVEGFAKVTAMEMLPPRPGQAVIGFSHNPKGGVIDLKGTVGPAVPVL